jgi:SNF2 family DNA or RNA helicase
LATNGILLLTYQVGANGLNLQCSNTVLLLDFWWNTGKINQAIARVLRYGQEAKKINIYYFTSNTGIEKILFDKQQAKLIVAKECQVLLFSVRFVL